MTCYCVYACSYVSLCVRIYILSLQHQLLIHMQTGIERIHNALSLLQYYGYGRKKIHGISS